VDAIWVNALNKREEIEEACRRIPAPVIAQRGSLVLDEWNKKARGIRWGIVPRMQDPILAAEKIRQLEDGIHY
jgi:hypothetical protein